MQVPTDPTPAQRAAIVQCLRIAAARGRAIREAQEKEMPSSVAAQDGGDQHGTDSNQSGVVSSIMGDKAACVKTATQRRRNGARN